MELLTVFAWRFRYPGSPEEPSESEARGDLDRAEATLAAVLERVPEEARP